MPLPKFTRASQEPSGWPTRLIVPVTPVAVDVPGVTGMDPAPVNAPPGGWTSMVAGKRNDEPPKERITGLSPW